MSGLTETQFVIVCLILAGIALVGVISYANRRRTTEPAAVERAHAFILGDPDDDDPDWDADRPALIWVSSPLLLDWLTQYGGPADADAIVGVDTAIPDATVRYVYPDEQVIDVSPSTLIARDVLPEWSAGPRAWASDADIDGHTYAGPPPSTEPQVRTRYLLADNDHPEYREVTQLRYSQCAFSEGYSVTVRAFDGEFYRGRIEEGRDAADGFVPTEPQPEVRYWVTRPSIGWHEHEVTQGVYVRLEHEFGFRTEVGSDPVTRWFCDRFMVSAWTTRDGDRGDAPTSFAHPRDCRAAWAEPVDTIAEAKLNEMAARMAQPTIERQTWPQPAGDPNDEVTAAVDHTTPRDRLREVAADVDRYLGIDRDLPQWADPIDDHGPRPVSHWDQPAKPQAKPNINGSPL